MSGVTEIKAALYKITENRLFAAEEFYQKNFAGNLSSAAYYQTLKRLCSVGELCRASKGIYYRPRKGRYGVVPLSQSEIISAYTKSNSGTVIGYTLYGRMGLTTQIGKEVEVLSSKIEGQTRRVGDVRVRYCNLDYTEETERLLHFMEVLQNFQRIQDLNYSRFIEICENIAQSFNETIFEQLHKERCYHKRTISFLRTILAYYHVTNSLERHLS